MTFDPDTFNYEEAVAQTARERTALQRLFTDEFLATLVRALPVASDDCKELDVFEVYRFTEWCFQVAGKPCPFDLYNR